MAANYLGQGWRAVISLAFVPVYIRYLGIEAYGLIGIYTMFQAWMGLMDMGMRPALTREMARFSAGGVDVQNIRDLLRTVEIVALLTATAASAVIWAASRWLATDWFKVQDLDLGVVAKAVVIMGIVAALRFLETIYAGCVTGLQRQVLDNVVSAGTATLRAVGAVGVLAWVSPTITAFFVWQGLVSVLTVAIYALVTHGLLPRPPRPARFSRAAIEGIWRFAAGMVVVTLLGLLLTQMDKLLLSRMLPLKIFGYYALASSVASVLYALGAPVTTAFYPRFVALVTQHEEATLGVAYHQAAQLIAVIIGSAAAVLMLFGDRVLLAWTRDPALVANAAPLLAVLALGSLLNALMWVPYYLQLAHGWTRLTVQVNTVAVAILLPALLVIVPIYGAISAAWVWVTLNAMYVIFVVSLIHRRLLTGEKGRWYRDDVAMPLLPAVATAAVCRFLAPAHLPRLGELLLLAVTGTVVLSVATLCAPLVRELALSFMMRRSRTPLP